MPSFLHQARHRIGRFWFRQFYDLATRATLLHPQARPSRHGVEHLRDLPYRAGGAVAHRLDIYRPAGLREPTPVVLYLHGGAFQILSKDSHRIMALGFARAGHVVAIINYRLAPRHPYPAAVQDSCAALEWVVDQIARFGGDPNRIALAGESAGANLATSLAVCASYRRPEPWARGVFDAAPNLRAVLPACGILEVSNVERLLTRNPTLSPWVGDRVRDTERGYLGRADPKVSRDLADPLRVLERGDRPDRPLPPFFACCGTADPLLDDTRRLGRAVNALGGVCEIAIFPGAVHAFHAMVWDRQARLCWAKQLAFLDRHLWGSAP
jgi:acetyl esterase